MIIGDPESESFIEVYEFRAPADYDDLYDRIKEGVTFFKWFYDNVKASSIFIIKYVLNNFALFGVEGYFLITKIFNVFEWYKEEEIKEEFKLKIKEVNAGKPILAYDSLSTEGFKDYTGVISSLFKDVLFYITHFRLTQRGFSQNEKGELTLNPNIFSEYIHKRFKIATLKDKESFIYDARGVWKSIGTENLLRMYRKVFHEAREFMWRPAFEAEYSNAISKDLIYKDDFNMKKDYINVRNGMLNIYKQDLGLMPHSPNFYSTIQLPMDYRPDAECPMFMEFLRQITLNEEAVIMLIQECFGYMLTPLKVIQKLIVWYGTGGNGKSLLADILSEVIGRENVSYASLKQLKGNHSLSALKGKLLNISTETKGALDSGQLKALIGDDPLALEPKGIQLYMARMELRLIFLLNRLPKTEDLSQGYFRKLQIVPFKQAFVYGDEFSDEEVNEQGLTRADLKLKEKLLTEREGILNFALEGLARLIKNNFVFTSCQTIVDSLREYKESQSPLFGFFDTIVIRNPSGRIRKSSILQAYKRWCTNVGNPDAGKFKSDWFWPEFLSLLTDKNIKYKEVRPNGYEFITGISVNPDYDYLFIDETPAVIGSK